jgi:hypothetical protein
MPASLQVDTDLLLGYFKPYPLCGPIKTRLAAGNNRLTLGAVSWMKLQPAHFKARTLATLSLAAAVSS